MRVLNWNCKGLGNASTVCYSKKIAREWKPDFMFLLETRLKQGQGRKLFMKWGFNRSFEVARIGLSGGLALGWNEDWEVLILHCSPHFIHTEVIDPLGNTSCITFFYGHPVLSLRNQVWEEIQRLGNYIHHAWLCIEDFNQVFTEADKFSFKNSSL